MEYTQNPNCVDGHSNIHKVSGKLIPISFKPVINSQIPKATSHPEWRKTRLLDDKIFVDLFIIL